MSTHARHSAVAPRAATQRADPWDAAVVGAGPAGSLAALHLARRGHDVLLLDRQAFPREKVCGDALLEDALDCLQRAGLLADVAARGYVPGSCAVHSPGGVELRLPGRFLTIKRVVLDDLLRSAAGASGASLAVATVTGISRSGESYVVGLADGSRVAARCVILAAGANPALPPRCGFTLRGRSGVAAAIRGYLTADASLDRLVVCYDRRIAPGYGWIFPLGGDEYNVGCGIIGDAGLRQGPDLHEVLNHFLTAFPVARELVARTRAATKPKGAVLRTALAGAEPVSPEGVLAVGETIGTTLSVTGEGIGKAMESAELAAAAAERFLVSGCIADLLSYRDSVQERLHPTFRGHERAQRWLARPWLVDVVCRRGNRNARYASRLASVLAGNVPPMRALSLRGILGSFLG